MAGLILHPVGTTKEDPSLKPTRCDICGVVRPLKYMKSIKWGYAMPGLRVDHPTQPQGYGAYQCPDEQHYGCTRDHAVLAMLACLFEHMDECEHEDQGKPYLHPLLQRLQQDLQAIEKDIAGIEQLEKTAAQQ
jgi:hypothetical protein